MKKPAPLFVFAIAAALIAAPGLVLAKGNPAAGQQKAATCEACHGKDGKSIDPNYPHLAGQHQSYLVKALTDYRAGRRKDVIMAGMAMNLTNQDIEDLAAWYASLDGLKDLAIK